MSTPSAPHLTYNFSLQQLFSVTIIPIHLLVAPRRLTYLLIFHASAVLLHPHQEPLFSKYSSYHGG